MKILLVEDEQAIADTLIYVLKNEGFTVFHVLLGGEVFPLQAQESFDLIILDVGLPDLSSVHEVYLTQMKDVMTKGVSPDMVEGLVRNWVPMGGAGVDLVKDLIGQFSGGASKSKPKKSET